MKTTRETGFRTNVRRDRRRTAVRRLTTVTAAALPALLLAGGLAVASPPTSDFSACLHDGSLRSVATGGTPEEPCKKKETEVHWNQVGPQGPQGLQGIPGVPGAAGLTGAAGADGRSPTETSTWHLSYVGDGVSMATVVDSVDAIPVGDSVQAIDATITGDFSACTDAVEITVTVTGRSTPTDHLAFFELKPGSQVSHKAPLNYGGSPPAVISQDLLVPGRPGLTITAVCTSMLVNGAIATPSFDLTLHFSWFHAPPVVTFS